MMQQAQPNAASSRDDYAPDSCAESCDRACRLRQVLRSACRLPRLRGTRPVGSTFQVSRQRCGRSRLFAVPLQLQFNPAVLQLVNVDAGTLLARDGQAVSIVHRDEGNGLVTISTSRPPNVQGVSGQGSSPPH